jgi:drug/metabolite transporter (DMT)-like permease
MLSAKGAGYILISALFYGSYGIWSRFMGPAFGEFSQAWTRGLVLLVFILLINIKFHFIKPIKRTDLLWFLIIAVAGGINQAPYYFGFQHLQIGTATLLFYASLVIGGYLLGKFALAEKINGTKALSLVLAIIGMTLVYRFSLTASQLLPAALTCLAGFLGSATVVLTKKLSGNYHEFQIMMGYFLLQILINGPLSFAFGESLPPFTHAQLLPWFAQLAYTVSMLVANFAAIEGFKHLEGSIGSLIGLAEILFGVFFGWLFFKEILSGTTFLGGALIIIAAAYPSLKERIPSDNKT